MIVRLVLLGLAGALGLCAIVSLLLGWFAIRNLWADYQDSSPSTYLLIGGFWRLLALICFGAAFSPARRSGD